MFSFCIRENEVPSIYLGDRVITTEMDIDAPDLVSSRQTSSRADGMAGMCKRF